MKIRFSKVATLFLAGAAVLAAGCTDYQSDINDIYTKIDELASKESVASLQSQVVVLSSALDALKSDHSKDIKALQSSIDALKSADAQFTSQIAALDGKIGDNAKDIASLQTSLNKTDETVAQLSSAFESYKNQVNTELSNLKSKDTELGEKIQAAETALRAEISALASKVDKEIKDRADADKVLGDKLDAAIKEAAENLKAAETRLNEKLAAESTRAQLAEQALQSAIDAEAKARAAGDDKLANELAKEVERAKQAETDIKAALTSEIERAKLAEKALEDAIAEEAKVREAADLLEAATREAADEKLQAGIDALKAALEAEIKRAAEVENALKVELHNTTLELDAAIKAEAAARAAADKETADALQSEIDRAKKAEDVLKRTIEAEKERASKAEELLNSAIADVTAALNAESDRAQKAENVLAADLAAEEVARLLADTRLDNLLKDELFARETADAQLAAALAAEAERAENAESALQLALEAEAVAREKADIVLQTIAEGIDNRLVSLQKDYNSFKSDVYAIIGGLSQRISANAAAISNINNVTIPAIQAQIAALQAADSLLRVDMEAGDKLVLDSLNVVKAATEKSIKALQDAVKDIVAVNKDQSDSLKAAFAKFDDYVLTTTFNAYQKEVEAALKAKADTAALNAAITTLGEHNNRILALERYKAQLVETIIPGLEAADKALRKDLDSLCLVVADVKENVDSLNSHMAKAEALLEVHTAAIADLNTRTSALEKWQVEAEKNIQSLLSRIRSVEFVPDYTDKYATIELALMQTSEKVTIDDDVTDDSNNDGEVYDEWYWDRYFKAFYTPSQITYKVYPVEMADSLVSYFKEHANDGSVYFDVIKLKNSGSRFDNEPVVVLNPTLKIIDVEKSNRTKGAITFTVLPKNVDDFKTVWEDAANFVAYGPIHGSQQDRLLTTAEKIALMISSDHTQLLSKLLGFFNKNEEEKFEPFYSSALVIEGVDGGAITSEYNVWTAGISSIFESPWFGINDPDKYDELYEEDKKWYPYINAGYLVKDVEYTDTGVYSIADSVELVSTYTIRGEESKTDKFENVVKILNVDLKADVAATREYSFDGTDNETLFKDVFTKSPANEYGEYGLDADRKPFTPEIDEFVKLKSRLNPNCDIQIRRSAIGQSEFTTYETGALGLVTDYFVTQFNITKTQAVAVVDTIKINWEYLKDVDVDAAIFNMGGEPGTGTYSRTGIALSFIAKETNLADKGVEISDFDGARSKLTEYEVKNRAGEVVANNEGVEELVVNLTLSSKKDTVYAEIRNFKWDEEYTLTAKYELEDADVAVRGVIVTKDRPRTPITLNYGTYTTEYKKDMDFQVRACMTFGGGIGYHTPTHENFTTSPINVRDSIVALYGPTANVPDSLHKDLWKNGADKAFVVPTPVESFYVDSRCVNKLYNVLYSNYKKAGDVVEYPDVEFYTYYGQKIIVKAKSTVTAPKYDFRHDNVQVLDDTKSKKYWTMPDVKLAGRFYSTAEPKFEDDIYPNFNNFNIEAIDFDKLFYIVDSNNVNLTADSISKAGLVANFEFRYPKNVESNNDNREDTEITITDNKLSYYGYDDTVSVKGTLAIKNDDGSMFYFPTSFDEGFESIYAAVIPEGEPTVGRYAKYQVVKFMPLQKLSAGEGTTIELYDAGKYYEPILKSLTLFDNRLPAKYPMVPVSSSAGESFTKGVNLFDGSDWKVGDGVNGFAAPDGDGSIYISKDVYHITTNYKLVPTKPENLSDNEWNDIYSRMKIKDTDDNKMPIAPQLEFDYTQQAGLDKIVIPIKVELLHPWIKTADYDYVNITIVNKK